MRVRRRHKEIASSIDAAVRAREDANDRLAAARDMIAVQGERARAERATIITALRRMREQNNLARLILDTVEKETGDDAGAAGRRSDG
jgi:F0F1-type ATP synthase membrane subunit b/b'